jgi:hydrogenase maturation factor HypF (carbamoyltransferase family)
MEIAGAKIRVTGIVQGVGFRPFIYGLAKQYSLVDGFEILLRE